MQGDPIGRRRDKLGDPPPFPVTDWGRSIGARNHPSARHSGVRI